MKTQAISTRRVIEWLEERTAEFDESAIAAVADLITDEVFEAMPSASAPTDLIDEGRVVARETIRLIVGRVLPAIGPPDAAAPVAVTTSLRTLVQRGHDVGVLLKAYRITQVVFWRYWMNDVEGRVDDPELVMGILNRTWDNLSAWFEAQVDGLADLYGEERDRWLRSALARRSEFVRNLLAGNTVDYAEATSVLNYDLRRIQTGLVIWADPTMSQIDLPQSLEDVAREFTARLGVSSVLTVPAGSFALWAWAATDGHPDLEALIGPPGAACPPGIRVAVGRPAAGIDGFCSTHHEAQLTHRAALLAARGDQLMFFDDFELASLMATDITDVRRLVRHELNELAKRDPNTARLRETARVYLASGGNAREAAERLYTHKNTVHYRLSRIEALLGRPITERRLKLEVALMLVDVFGDAVLADDASLPPGSPSGRASRLTPASTWATANCGFTEPIALR